MRYARLVVVLFGVLATTLCVLFPLCQLSDTPWAPMPLWLFYALNYKPDENGYLIVDWVPIIVEICFVVSLFCVLYRTTFFYGREAVRYGLYSLILPALGFASTHFARLEYYRAGLDDYLAVLGITYYLQIAFLMGTVRIRKRQRGRSIRVGRLDEAAPREAGRGNRIQRTWKERAQWTVRVVSRVGLCVAILLFPFEVRGEFRDTIVYSPLFLPPPDAHFRDYIDLGWLLLQYGVQVLVASFIYAVLYFATSPAPIAQPHASGNV